MNSSWMPEGRRPALRPQEYQRGKGIRRPVEVETRTLEELREVGSSVVCENDALLAWLQRKGARPCLQDGPQGGQGTLTVTTCNCAQPLRLARPAHCAPLQPQAFQACALWLRAYPVSCGWPAPVVLASAAAPAGVLRPWFQRTVSSECLPLACCLMQVLAILDGAGPDTMITRIMLDNMTRKDPGAPCEPRLCRTARACAVLPVLRLSRPAGC